MLILPGVAFVPPHQVFSAPENLFWMEKHFTKYADIQLSINNLVIINQGRNGPIIPQILFTESVCVDWVCHSVTNTAENINALWKYIYC